MKIQKLDPKNYTSTSFHDATVQATLETLINCFGEPADYGMGDKVQYEWELQLEDGTCFTLYDWKNTRRIEPKTMVSWHIGHQHSKDAQRIKQAITSHIRGKLSI